MDSGYMLVYISLRSLTPGNKRSGYMGKIIKSAKDLNFDESYIAELEALVST